MLAVVVGGWLAAPEKKAFKPKYQLPVLDRYDTVAVDQFWSGFPVFKPATGQSMVNATQLVELAHQFGCSDWDRLFTVCQDLKYGAKVGCEGLARAASFSQNAKSSFKFGQQVTDAIADWVKKGFAAGPFDESEVPAAAKVNSIMCREKPNGSVRIILNLSAPAGMSVNDGIEKDLYPATMSSTQKWLEVLDQVGKSCWMAKTDWSDAYKHLHVRGEDLILQWFSWLGKFFYELCLIFGSSSSPGLYDRLAKTVLDLVIIISKFPRHWVCQHLDDAAAACPADSDALEAFDRTYQDVAKTLGIKLAPRDDPEKAFPPSKRGIVFGIAYDSEDWTWTLPTEKIARIAVQIKNILEVSEVRQDEIQSVVGRIVHIKPLIRDSRFHLDYLMQLLNVTEKPDGLVELNDDFKRQLYFWYILLVSHSGKASIPAPEIVLPPWALECYTDAAGGTLEAVGRGAGALFPALGTWSYLPWSRQLNSGKWVVGGKKVSRKLAALELIGPLIGIASNAQAVRGKPIKFLVDNQGSCSIWRQGYSNCCRLSNTIVRAIAIIAASLGCQVDICKIRRCSNPGALMADAISKADWAAFRQAGGSELQSEPCKIPLAVLSWCQKPIPDDELGRKILTELAKDIPILGYNC